MVPVITNLNGAHGRAKALRVSFGGQSGTVSTSKFLVRKKGEWRTVSSTLVTAEGVQPAVEELKN